MNLEAFVCQHKGCNLIYENPVTFPCGNSLCQQHLENNDEKLICPFCSEEHQKPSVNKAIIKMIDSFIQLVPLRKKINELFENIDESIKKYQEIKSDVYIDSFFYEIRNKVDLHREELKKDIDDRSDEIIRILKEKEEKCKLNAHKLEKKNINELKTNNNYLSLKQKLRCSNLNEDELYDLSLVLNDKFKEAENHLRKYKNDLLLNESIKFVKYENSNVFGELIIDNFISNLSPNCDKLIKIYNTNGHSDLIRSIQVCLKSKKLISSSNDKTIKIWNLDSGACLKTLVDHKNSVTSVLIIPNNRFISGSYDKTIKIWDLNSYICLNTILNEAQVFSMCLIKDNLIAAGCHDGLINIWNFDSSTKLNSFKAHDTRILYLLLFDKTKLISCSGDITIKIWDLKTFECIKSLEGHLAGIMYLELTLDGDLLSCSYDKTVKLWQIETGKILKSIEFEHRSYRLKVLNDNLIAIGLENGEIQIYDFKRGEKVKTFSAHSSKIFQLNFVSNLYLFSGSQNGEIKLWKIFE